MFNYCDNFISEINFALNGFNILYPRDVLVRFENQVVRAQASHQTTFLGLIALVGLQLRAIGDAPVNHVTVVATNKLDLGNWHVPVGVSRNALVINHNRVDPLELCTIFTLTLNRELFGTFIEKLF